MFFSGFPGDDGPGGFPGFGGFPGMGAEMDDEEGGESGPVDTESYYKILGVDKKASQRDIQKAYRKKAMKLHPDKHPDEKEKYQELFQELGEAYEVLKDPQTRQLYDRYGKDGVKSGGGNSGLSDIFNMFFEGGGPMGGGMGGGGGGRRGRSQRKKAPPIRQALDVTLEDLYAGRSKKIDFTRMQACKKCNGKGGSKVVECKSCNGNGTQVVVQQVGYMTLQQERRCPTCEGEGTMIKESDQCGRCEGKGMKKESKTLSVPIPQGTKHADQVLIRGQGHEIPQMIQGDIVLIIRCMKHKLFQRLGADLAMEKKISLKEALCGYDFKIPHLSGKTLRLKSKKGEICQQGELKAIQGWGMPQKNNPSFKGNIYIKIDIVMPTKEELTEKAIGVLGRILPRNKEAERKEKEAEEKIRESERKKQEAIERAKRRQARRKAREDGDGDASMAGEGEGGEKSDGEGDDDEDDGFEEEPLVVHEEAHTVIGDPKPTPASSKSAYDEDEEEQSSGCRQM